MSPLLLILAAPAQAWDNTTTACPGGQELLDGEWWLVDLDNDWDAAMETAIIDAAEQWDGGFLKRNRGYAWNYAWQGAGGAIVHGFGVNEVGDATFAHLTGFHNQPNDIIALTVTSTDTVTCEVLEFDIEAVDTDTVAWTWTDNPPSWGNESATTTYSLPAVLVHEFGHGIGFQHITDPVSVMERRLAAELGGEFRIHENDYAGMLTIKADSTAGKNFMLGKWVSNDPSDRGQSEMWKADGAPPNWQVTAGGTLPAGTSTSESAGPGPIMVAVNGVSTYSNVPVVWTISSDGICLDGDDVEVATRNFGLISNSPIVADHPAGYVVPAGTPAGLYWLCAGINTDFWFSETDYDDNVVISERLVQVL